ncbi:hypothetical protein [Aurantiacibacter odishensis]|uniref:hypothetical protein n=1 Tax=Aurantiacibacter odishensis TaxID=1155476 RepID=UPI000E72F9A7|nr:hypothetical protein [Aurantiacibacter odishensis]
MFRTEGVKGSGGAPVKNSFRLRGMRPDSTIIEEMICEAADIVEAIGIASRHFGVGEVELRCWRSRDYEIRLHADKSWSLKPLYTL